MYVIEEFEALFMSGLEHFHEEIGFVRWLLWYFGKFLCDYRQVLPVKSVWVPAWVNEWKEPTMFTVMCWHGL